LVVAFKHVTEHLKNQISMNNLFNPSNVSEILERVEKLTPDTQRQWGKMNVAQMMEHCNVSLETAMGHNIVKGPFIGKIIGAMLKPGALSEKPFGKNSPTDKSYIFPQNVDFGQAKSKIKTAIKQFHEGGPANVTVHPHPFFGKFTPEQWAVFQWKHLDHHLRQFGV
jgi:hypothetical protein